MRKEFATTTIKRLFELKKQQDQLSDLGISIYNFTDQYSSLLEESIAVLYSKNEKEFENILENLILFLDQVEPGSVENFVSWLEFEYGKDLSLGDKVSLNGNICECEPHTYYQWEKDYNKCSQCNKPLACIECGDGSGWYGDDTPPEYGSITMNCSKCNPEAN